MNMCRNGLWIFLIPPQTCLSPVLFPFSKLYSFPRRTRQSLGVVFLLLLLSSFPTGNSPGHFIKSVFITHPPTLVVRAWTHLPTGSPCHHSWHLSHLSSAHNPAGAFRTPDKVQTLDPIAARALYDSHPPLLPLIFHHPLPFWLFVCQAGFFLPRSKIPSPHTQAACSFLLRI